MIIMYTIDKSIKQNITGIDSAKGYLYVVEKKFTKFNKAKKEILMKLINTTTNDGISGVLQHIIKLTHFFNKFKRMKVELPDSFFYGKYFNPCQLSLMYSRLLTMLKKMSGVQVK